MESRKHEEENDRRREEGLARRIGEALDGMSSSGGECPSAEIIAAYHERALEIEESGRWENHFAGCSRCRKILAVLAASVEAPLAEAEVARLGELVASADRASQAAPSQKVKPFQPRKWDWRARWLAPALGVAAALAVWFAMRPPWRLPSTEPAGTLIAQAPKTEAPQEMPLRSLDQLSSAKPEENAKAVAPSAKNQPSAKDLAVNPEPALSARNREADGNPVAENRDNLKAAERAITDEKKEQNTLSDAVPAGASAAAPAPPPAPATPPQAFVKAPGAPVPPGSQTQAVTVTSEAAAVSTASRTSGSVAASSGANIPSTARNYTNLSKPGAPVGIYVKVTAPSGKVLWRAGRAGKIERSSDSGSKWNLQESPLHEDWLAGSAISDKACWLAGRNGAIARTKNGKRWEIIVPPPTSANTSGKLPDWIGIAAADENSATITSMDQRHYATKDGGKTWQGQ